MKTERTKMIISIAIMVACQVVLERVLAINTMVVKIGFGFVPLVIVAILYGSWWAAVAGALADIIGTFAVPIGPYFPGFTVTAFLAGMIYGLYLKNLDKIDMKKAIIRSILAAVTVSVVISLVLNTAMIAIVFNYGVMVLLPSRAIQAGEMIVVQSILIPLFCRNICRMLRTKGGKKRNVFHSHT